MMKKRAFKRNLALGVLIACSLTGPVYADSVNVASGEEKNDASIITVKNGESFTNAGTVNASDSITIDKGTFVNSGTINTGTLDILGLNNGQVSFTGGDRINATEQIIYRGTQGSYLDLSLDNTILDTPVLTIQGAPNTWVGLKINSTENLSNVDRININSPKSRTALVIAAGSTVNINAPVHLNGVDIEGSDDARIEVYEGANLTVDTIISEAGKTKVQLDGDGTHALWMEMEPTHY